ncbi:MAG: hypothetical protein J0L76_01255 [Rhodobacterales bacterium]|nr:hypothetical protein [Rhodobacterales bacterium]
MQAKLIAAAARLRGRNETPTDSSILTGKLRDETGDPLTPTHTLRHGRRFRYYVSNRLIAGGIDPTGWRLPGPALEAILRQIVIGHLRKHASSYSILAEPDASGAADLLRRANAMADRIDAEPGLVGAFIASGTIGQNRLELHLDPRAIAHELSVPEGGLAVGFLNPSHSVGAASRQRSSAEKWFLHPPRFCSAHWPKRTNGRET